MLKCSDKIGPDLIFVLWDGAVPLFVLVQAKTGADATNNEALLTLKYLYTHNRVKADRVVPAHLQAAARRGTPSSRTAWWLTSSST